MKAFDVIRASRRKILNITKELSTEALNHIPDHMNNNILWNMAHIIATQQNLCYLRSGLMPVISESFIERYKVGTKPGGLIDTAEYEVIRHNLQDHIDQLEEDYKKEAFLNFQAFTSATYTGLTINTIDEGLTFLAFHEGLHLGYIMAMKRHIVL